MVAQGRSWAPVLALLFALYTLVPFATMVKHENFKTCEQSGFCTRNRVLADNATKAGDDWVSPYNLDPSTIKFNDGVLKGIVLKQTALAEGGDVVRLPVKITFLASGAARVTLDEEDRRLKKKSVFLRTKETPARVERYNEAERWAIVGGLEPSQGAAVQPDAEEGTTKVLWGEGGKHEAVIRHKPFGMEFKRDGETHVKLNERGLMSMEHWRPQLTDEQVDQVDLPQDVKDAIKGADQSTWWDESFGSSTDSKPRGPESVGMDITFPGYEYVYGIPEHAGPMSLRQTRAEGSTYTDPYRLYNLDVFEYEVDSPMTLYGAIPFMQAKKKDSLVGVFWLNAAETWVDILKIKTGANPLSLGTKAVIDTQTHWFSESGVLDLFVFLGPTPQDMAKTYSDLTGYTYMPPQFSIAYHQCRWNYITDQDVKDVDRKFDKHDIPYDVIWLDIEYTEGKKYFTWDPLSFVDPIGMQKQLDAHERKLVAIIDPHIKEADDYFVIQELKDKGLAVKNKENEPFTGWCWPGSSMWPDFFNPLAVEWWKTLFQYNRWVGSTKSTHLWNDMNEPSVFNGPETTMTKDNIHHGNWEHRDVHNINGLTFANATFHAMLERDGAKKPIDRRRPFVLTRSFYAGSQRMGAMWTGDNLAAWSHLEVAIPMLLNNGISGFPFAGADVGGFFGNPEKELLTRWYQAGIFYPFMRAHAHIDTRRREPYLLEEPYQGLITQAIRLRYQLLPAWYTAFHEAHTTGAPIIRPNWFVHPSDEAGFALDDQLYLGSTGLLAKPVVTEGATTATLYLADAAPYYDYFDLTAYTGAAGRKVTVPAPLERIPLLMQAGHVIPRRDRPRRSSGLMKWDPFTLVVVLDPSLPGGGAAEGTLYVDDGESYAHTEGAYVHRRFVYDAEAQALMSEDLVGEAERKGKPHRDFVKRMEGVAVEKVVVVGAPAEWKEKTSVPVVKEGGGSGSEAKPYTYADVTFEAAKGGRAAWAVVRKPGVGIGEGWKIDFS